MHWSICSQLQHIARNVPSASYKEYLVPTLIVILYMEAQSPDHTGTRTRSSVSSKLSTAGPSLKTSKKDSRCQDFLLIVLRDLLPKRPNLRLAHLELREYQQPAPHPLRHLKYHPIETITSLTEVLQGLLVLSEILPERFMRDMGNLRSSYITTYQPVIIIG